MKAALAGPRDYFAALAFSARGDLLAGVTYHGSVLVFRVTGPAGPVRVTTRPGVSAAYAVAFTPDGRTLTVVIDRPETWPSTAARDTVFTWRVAGSGALSGLGHRRPGTPVDPALTRSPRGQAWPGQGGAVKR
jgi:hypothetical protein